MVAHKMLVRGVRGAITAHADTEEEILNATEEILRAMMDENGIDVDMIASVLFTSSPDLTACYPARAARRMGWTMTPLLGFQEMDVPDGLPRCIRVLIHWNTDKSREDIKHVYLRDAASLRPDLTNVRLNGDHQSEMQDATS